MGEWRKPKPTDGVISRYVNRKVSTRITAFILKHGWGVTPNQITVISLLTALFTAGIILAGHLIIGGIMIQVSSMIDGVDGELARARGVKSKFGGFLDAMMDRFADVSIISALTYVYTLNPPYGLGGASVAAIGMLALTGDLLVSYIHARGEASLGTHPSKVGKLRGFASRDVRLFILAVATALLQGVAGMLIVGVISYVYVVGKVIEVWKHSEAMGWGPSST
ncbi:MAG: CDP-alcohol phosphatidyltransferase family protein [Desulfurococcales archaeon]|nr:CDP-alcohol phosphatidyltransferase family protein [Desulfurococcales archaeon]